LKDEFQEGYFLRLKELKHEKVSQVQVLRGFIVIVFIYEFVDLLEEMEIWDFYIMNFAGYQLFFKKIGKNLGKSFI
jgi:hypothetical protein